jgi:aldehyde dehydrogenase (NAD+)
LSPLIGAIAAGNCAIIKPSEISRYTSAFLRKYIPQYFREEHVTVIEGGKETTEELLKFPFDHIFFTGSTRVGKVIMEAASKHLSPVTLELGGKSPVIVDDSAHLAETAEKIAWGKFLNGGQTCVAPDYILIEEHLWPRLKPLLIAAIEKFYGPLEQQKESTSLARMISTGHAQRLETMIKEATDAGAELVYGGKTDVTENYVGPAILEKVDLHSGVMQEEIFGPILPIVTYKGLQEAIQFVNDRPKPLAMYIFSHSRHNVRKIINETSSGGAAINETILHVGNHHLPFGGVGASGLGNYHGYFGFRAFSHERAVLRRRWGNSLLRRTYPPYTTSKVDLIKSLLRWRL